MKVHQVILAIFLGACQSVHIKINEEGEPPKIEPMPIKSIISNEKPELNQDEFNKMFIREDGLNHILLSDVNRFIAGL